MGDGSAGLEAALEELYGAEPSEFTKVRDAIAKRLKADGDADAAASVRTRRKPTLVAWVLNQLARRHPDDVAELVDVGRELAREQRKALRGEASGSFRESIDRQRKVVGDLTRKTALLMKELGVTPGGHLDEIAPALQAALVDPVIGAQLEEGRLEKPPEPAAGFAGPMPETSARAKEPEPAKAPPERPKKRTASPKDAAAEKAARQKALAKERAEREAHERAQKKAAAKARAEHEANERARKKAVAKAQADVRDAEAQAQRRQAEAEKAEQDARRAIERAKTLAEAAETSARLAEEARKELVRVRATT